MSVCHLNRAGTSTRCGATPNLGDSRDPADVTCPDCSQLIRDGEYREQHRRDWTVAAVAGDTELGFTDWLEEKLGVGAPTPLPGCTTPPRMVDGNGLTDGVFIFYGDHSDLGGQLEVVPMTTGNVEFTISSDASQQGGLVFNLSHLDRIDLVRALLHDFHYSPEKDGPSDDDD